MRVCVFCGSSPGRTEIYRRAAADLAVLLAHKGIGLVYGGGNVGLMGIAADAALAAGGEVIGVIPGHLVAREVSHEGLSRLEIVDTMHERKARMADLSDAFVALPGAAGTLDELFEIWTWSQLGLHDKPIGLLDVAGYYQPMLAFLDHMVAEEFLRPAYRDALVVETDPRVLVDRLSNR
ncbi:hypothetical protein SAMN05421678_109218 [Actinopolymorpha cephalotaxi]|uniref:Cytokinin riboside 5'-monophosphate phosphoribohydrolase n=1 Tax=Actinopolymorpha cephalotaxi TaxID=504797 RepID=A0A1I2VK48_9ACTN|nr:TIGR00730 family Rossman fold protein [Actinopolymorpha cephalotaxi]NYH83288.1 hypothetical protein [Actinopolymorpha cephalotaxi]SFG89674.1 hypothetical protein SAMN05421678_109218 [Actinopolymorpha cephalotaxi]